MQVIVEIEQVEARHRAFGHVDGEFLDLEHALALAGFPGRDEGIDDALGFAENAEIGLLINVRGRGDGGSANGDRLAARMAEIDDFQRIALLRQHAARHHEVGPGDILVGQFLGIAVDQAHRPMTSAASPPR